MQPHANRGLRILRIAERLPPFPGGKEIHVAELSSAQAAIGDEIKLMYRFGDPSPLEGVRLSQIRLPSMFKGGKGSLVFSAMAAARASGVGDFDVVHVHGDFPEVPGAAWLARRHRVPLVVTVHGGMNGQWRSVSRAVFRHVDHFIALGPVVRRQLLERGVPTGRITVLTSGLNEELLDRAKRERCSEDTPRLVTVGALDPVKNQESIIDALRLLPSDLDPELVIVGTGPLEGRLRQRARGSNVRFAGGLGRLDVYRTILSARVFVMSSRPTPAKSEGVPTALLEAMYLGRHCLVSEEVDLTGVIEEGSYERIVPTADGIARALLAALTDADRSSSFGARAAAAAQGLGWPARARVVDQIMRGVLSV